MLTGRTDNNKRCLFPAEIPIPESLEIYQSFQRNEKKGEKQEKQEKRDGKNTEKMDEKSVFSIPETGDFVVVKIIEARCHTLRGLPVCKSTITDFSKLSSSMYEDDDKEGSININSSNKSVAKL